MLYLISKQSLKIRIGSYCGVCPFPLINYRFFGQKTYTLIWIKKVMSHIFHKHSFINVLQNICLFIFIMILQLLPKLLFQEIIHQTTNTRFQDFKTTVYPDFLETCIWLLIFWVKKQFFFSWSVAFLYYRNSSLL